MKNCAATGPHHHLVEEDYGASLCDGRTGDNGNYLSICCELGPRYAASTNKHPKCVAQETPDTQHIETPSSVLAAVWADAYASGVSDERTSQSNPGIAGCFCTTPLACRCVIAPARANPFGEPDVSILKALSSDQSEPTAEYWERKLLTVADLSRAHHRWCVAKRTELTARAGAAEAKLAAADLVLQSLFTKHSEVKDIDLGDHWLGFNYADEEQTSALAVVAAVRGAINDTADDPNVITHKTQFRSLAAGSAVLSKSGIVMRLVDSGLLLSSITHWDEPFRDDLVEDSDISLPARVIHRVEREDF